MNDDPIVIARAIPKVIEAAIAACPELSLVQMRAVFGASAETMQQAQQATELALVIQKLRSGK